ncbi:MAG: hypothetical protein LBG42_09630 [Treponema sp.]|nr:hypothetical protein [Treponema sp.]
MAKRTKRRSRLVRLAGEFYGYAVKLQGGWGVRGKNSRVRSGFGKAARQVPYRGMRNFIVICLLFESVYTFDIEKNQISGGIYEKAFFMRSFGAVFAGRFRRL